MSWKIVIKDLIEKEFKINEEFNLNDLIKHEQYLKELYPLNNNILPKIRQQLQILRNDGYIEFIDNNGRYRRIK